MTVTSSNFDARELDENTPPKWWNRRIRTRAQVTEIAVMFGALSVVSFWAAGLGVAAGIIAVASALWADRTPDLTGERAERTDTALAVGTGIVGVIVGVGFLAMVL
ncbi:hypothetical protein CH275_05065 [Rhodococcus sp. 06-235-1A]|uniref:hypothetical protein n=1 Tax=Rhodococcus sp. 06-235-1A TaxID=2022508 RepID=UPI000B9AC9EA|nr:hypothetical protein [Rhodococcus sp. 06-235-1A]OZD07945.1 hypothetical protein CH275_05065 [Rhodococcus sp. 06-235-1A]